MRVKVYDGTGKNYLGEGTYVGDVAVWVFWNGEGMGSLPNAERSPSRRLTESMQKQGRPLMCILDCPKIEMDDGTVKYGCQVWWEPVPPPKIFREYLGRLVGKVLDALGKGYPQKRGF